MAKQETEELRGLNINYTIYDVERDAACPDQYSLDGIINLSGKGKAPKAADLKKVLDAALAKWDEQAKKKLSCDQYLCLDDLEAECLFDSALKGDLDIKEFTLTGHLHNVKRTEWTATQAVRAGCFCISEA